VAPAVRAAILSPVLPSVAPDRRADVIRILYPDSLVIGGSERQLLLLAEHLPRDRFEVSFVLPGPWTTNADLAAAVGARVTALGAGSRRSTPMPIYAARVARQVLEYIRICRRERFDIVDAWLYLSYGLAALTRPVARVPILINGRRSLSDFKETFGPVERAIDALARRQSDAIVANASAIADDVARREGIARDRIRVIRNGVKVAPALADRERARLREEWRAGPDDVIIGCVGAIKPAKGQTRLLELLPHIIATIPTARLVLIGGGPQQQAVEMRAAAMGLADRVTLTGDVPDARPLYGAFDVLVSASLTEGLPNAVLEAAAAGIGIVATDAGGTGEIVADGVHGLLVPVSDDERLGEGVIRLAGDPELRRRLGAAARHRATTEFSIERFVTETAALYETLVARRPAPRSRR